MGIEAGQNNSLVAESMRKANEALENQNTTVSDIESIMSDF